MIAEVPRSPICSTCAHSIGGCPTPEACEQAEADRESQAARRDLRIAVTLIVAALGTLALFLTFHPT